MKTIDITKIKDAINNSNENDITDYMWEIIFFLSNEVVINKGVIKFNQNLIVDENDAKMDICINAVARLKRQYKRGIIESKDKESLQLLKWLRSLVNYAYLDYKAFVYRINERSTRNNTPQVVSLLKKHENIVGDDEDSIINMIDNNLI